MIGISVPTLKKHITVEVCVRDWGRIFVGLFGGYDEEVEMSRDQLIMLRDACDQAIELTA